jgi:hypothetical protein
LDACGSKVTPDGSGVHAEDRRDLVERCTGGVLRRGHCDEAGGPFAVARYASSSQVVHDGGSVDGESFGQLVDCGAGDEGLHEFIDLV